jgi:hypothetical protein
MYMLPFHLLSLGFVVGVSAIADKDALAWVRGARATLDRTTLRSYHAMMWIGLVALTVTGLWMLIPTQISLLSNLLFDIKLLFVAILYINAVLIGRLMDHAVTKPFRAVPAAEKRALVASGAISAVSWGCAAVIAFVMFG